MSALPRILVADVPSGVRTLENVISTSATILGTQTLEKAIMVLRSGVELIVCGIHFDESRMFDLLRLAKADPSTRALPFLCFRDMDSALPGPFFEGMDIACKALGAVGFVDLFQLKVRYGLQEADAQFRRMVMDLLTSSSS